MAWARSAGFQLPIPRQAAKASRGSRLVSWLTAGVGRLGAAGSPIIAGFLFKAFGDDQLLLVSFLMALGSLAALVLFLLLPMRDANAEVAEGVAGRPID